MTKDTTAFDTFIQDAIHYLKQNDLIHGEEELKHAMVLNPSSCIVHNLYGIAEELTGNDTLARKHYRVANEFDPTYQPAIHNLERITSFSPNKFNFDFGEATRKIAHSVSYYLTFNKKHVGQVIYKDLED